VVLSDGGRSRPALETSSSPVIAFAHVSFGRRTGLLRRRRQLFDSLTFRVQAGEAVGFLLPSGAGKTDLVKLATGHITPSFGSVSILGLSPATESAELTSRVGTVVNEHSHLWLDVPLGDSLAMLGRYLNVPEPQSSVRRAGLVERLELTRALKIPVGALTPGQRRRAELVAALLPDPDVLILDEPTRGMDAASKERLRSVLRQENRMNGRTLLVASSELSDVESLCPRLLVGVDGRIGFDGDVSTLTELIGTERILVVDLLHPIEPLDDLPGAQLIAVETGGLRQRLALTPGKVTTAKVLADVVSRAPVRNLTLEEPDLSEMVRRLTP
jgi:ABC-2 type transport system ATP-binding protein